MESLIRQPLLHELELVGKSDGTLIRLGQVTKSYRCKNQAISFIKKIKTGKAQTAQSHCFIENWHLLHEQVRKNNLI